MVVRNPLAIEPVLDSPEQIKSSDRSFGIVFSVALTIIGVWPLLDGHAPRFWVLLVACTFGLIAAFASWMLQPLNALWMHFGALLHRIVTPVVMGVVFFLTVLPTALVMRAFRKDLLRLKLYKNAGTYWIERKPGPDPQTMTRQY